MKLRGLLALALLLFTGCSSFRASEPAPEAEAPVPLFDGLGSYTRPTNTTSTLAQQYFDQGLSFLFAFNHDEAIRSFRKMTELDPEAPMGWWGIAIANGPHINNPVLPAERSRAASAALRRADELFGSASDVEKALIAAQSLRYADPPPADRKALDEAYAAGMRRVWRKFPNDPDVGAMFAEALMDLRPWNQWTEEGKPQPGTLEVLATLERVMKIKPDHPLALHLYIHAVEASLHPQKALPAANRLRDLQPGLGHLVHMPSHIDVRLGNWRAAMVANRKAIAADTAYRAKSAGQDFYRLYMAHNHHMLSYAAMMIGRSAEAKEAMDEMVANIPEDWAKESAMIADGFMAMPLEVRMRFGNWDEILAADEFPEHFPLARALRHYARGVAYAAKNDTKNARQEQKLFRAAAAEVPAEAFFNNNTAAGLLAVAGPVLEGEIAYREGDVEGGLRALREGVEKEDELRYDEPPSWIQPVRHALGATLLQEKRYREAEKTFREDLKRLPENGWGLFGLWQSLKGQNRTKEAAAVEERFRTAWAGADTFISSPCFCQPAM